MKQGTRIEITAGYYHRYQGRVVKVLPQNKLSIQLDTTALGRSTSMVIEVSIIQVIVCT